MKRHGFAIAASVILLSIALPIAWALSFLWRDPIAVLPVASTPLADERIIPQADADRVLREVALRDPALGVARFSLSLPHPLPDRRLPVVVVLGGLKKGAASISLIENPGDNILVGYDWPFPFRAPPTGELIRRLPEFYRQVMATPGQIAAMIDWLAGQPWADPQRMSLLAFSLGSLAAPAAQRLAQIRGREIGWTVLAYGGTPLGGLLADHPKLRAAWYRRPLGRLADRLLFPLEPAEHLPHLTGRFLILTGTTDRFIPEAAARRLEELTPPPKTIVRFEGDHLGTGIDERALLRRIIAATRSWLEDEGALECHTASTSHRCSGGTARMN